MKHLFPSRVARSAPVWVFASVWCLAFWVGAVVPLAAQPATAGDWSLEATVSRTEVTYGEPVELTLLLSRRTANFGATGLAVPNIPDIPGFVVSSRNSSQEISMVNGQGLATVRSMVQLVAEKPGDYTIPAFNLKTPDGAILSTRPISIKVKERVAAPPADDTDSEAPAQDGAAETEPRGGVGIWQALALVGGIIVLILTTPLILSYLMNPGSGRSRFASTAPAAEVVDDDDDDAVRARNAQRATGTNAAPAANSAAAAGMAQRDASQARQPLAPPVAPAVTASEFDDEITRIARDFPEVSHDFYRRFFDAFHRAVLGSVTRPGSNLTPAELMQTCVEVLPTAESGAARRLAAEWEEVTYAAVAPARPWRDLLGDARLVLQALATSVTAEAFRAARTSVTKE